MKRFLKSINVHELLRPLGQMVFFSLGTTVVLSAIALVLALILDRTVVGQTLFERLNVTLYTYTLVNLPQVAIDGLTIGFVYAAIALGYTMVYGVLEFINFAHSEIFAVGAFVGVEILIALDKFGILAGASLVMAYVYLILAIVGGMLVSRRTGRCRGTRGLSAAAPCITPGAADLGHRRLLSACRMSSVSWKA